MAYEDDLGIAESEVQDWRNDVAAIITPSEGQWGGWQQARFCNDGWYAVGYQMRVEGSQGGGDDTALNAIRLTCRNPLTGQEEVISAHEGNWGSWGTTARCSGTSNYLDSARMRVEASQGGGDDTGGNSAQFGCTRTISTLTASGGGGWGSWLGWTSCPARSAVCGIDVKFESSQGGGDDTAMNGMRLYCCSLPCNNDGVCSGLESPWSCSNDCGPIPPICDDGSCNGNETHNSCPQDCGPPPPVCGDGICNESPTFCPEDCGGGNCQSARASGDSLKLPEIPDCPID